MSYGNGGKKTSKLIEELIVPVLGNTTLNSLGDGALISTKGELAFSTDSFVIYPYFFPGGDIGKLSVCGTVNDLLMCGSIPKYLSLSLIIEEGFIIKDLKRIVQSIGETAEKSGVIIATGDTKVVDRGHGHGIYINTAGIGEKIEGIDLRRERINKGDKIIVSGSCGNHGVSILCARENFIESSIESDCAPLNDIVRTILMYGKDVKLLRDPTRGGVATTLNEFIEGMKYSIEIDEQLIPIDDDVSAACDLLGIDPLYSANEGKVLAVVSESVSDSIVDALRQIKGAEKATVIGEVIEYSPSRLLLKTKLGGRRILDKLSHDMLPRIC